MKLKSRILGVSAGVMVAVSMTVAPAFAAAPVGLTGEVAYDQGEMSSRGSCSTIAVGTILNAEKTFGLNNDERLVTSSSKGYARNAADFAAFRVGSCSVRNSAGFTGTPVFGDYTNKDVAKFGTKLTGISDCNSVEGADPDERPLTGKMSIGFSDNTKLDDYIRVQGFDTDAADKVWLTGIVSKGEGVGTTIGGSVWFNPAAKVKQAIGYYGDPVADDIKTPTVDESQIASGIFTGPAVTLAKGYATGAAFTIGEAINCQSGTGAVGMAYGVPGLDLIGLGGGSLYPSPALETVADGVQFLL